MARPMPDAAPVDCRNLLRQTHECATFVEDKGRRAAALEAQQSTVKAGFRDTTLPRRLPQGRGAGR